MRSSAARKRDDDQERHRPPKARGASGPQRAPKPRARRAGVVLIADDTKDMRELYMFYLTHQGFAVHTVADGVAAVEAAIRLRPDVIVMDLAMPQIDGITATLRLRQHQRTRETPVILLTGYSERVTQRGALEAGVDVFLTKPCLPEDLETHVRRLLEPKRRR